MRKRILFVLLYSLVNPVYGKLQGSKPQWQEIQDAPPVVKNHALKVALLIIGKWDAQKNDFQRYKNGDLIQKRCTGFLVAPKIIMTNWHCIKHPKQVTQLKARFNFEKNIPNNEYLDFKCDKFWAHDRDLDMAFIECDSPSPYLNQWVQIDARTFPVINKNPKDRDREMYIIHHQCKGRHCQAHKKFQFERIRDTGAKSAKHDADTLGGSSGAPIFDKESNRVIALHHEGNPALNQAIPFYKIIKRMKYLSKKNPIYQNLLNVMKIIR